MRTLQPWNLITTTYFDKLVKPLNIYARKLRYAHKPSLQLTTAPYLLLRLFPAQSRPHTSPPALEYHKSANYLPTYLPTTTPSRRQTVDYVRVSQTLANGARRRSPIECRGGKSRMILALNLQL